MAQPVYSVEKDSFGFLLLDLREENEQLFLYTLHGYKYLLRPLFISEIESVTSLSSTIEDYIIDEWVINRTLLLTTASKDYLTDTGPAGVVSALASSIMAVSSVGTASTMLDSLTKERDKLASDLGVVQTTMLAGTGNILGKNFKKITAREQSKYLAIAEAIIGKKLEVEPVKQATDKKGRKKPISPEVAAMLSPQAADKPDIESDNKMFRAL